MEATYLTTQQRWKEYGQKRDEIFYTGWEKASDRWKALLELDREYADILEKYYFDEMLIDNFAGGGGASVGMEFATGRSVDVAINHDRDSITMHEVNHPETKHYCEDVWAVDPEEVVGSRRVGLVWLSPDCKHFSKAKGGKPVEKNIRGLAWVGIRWASKVRPRVIILENVEEFVTWGPLVTARDKKTGRVIKIDGTLALPGEVVPYKDQKKVPDPKFKGRTFQQFVKALKNLGYQVEWKELRASDYGVPTIRKRFFLIARCDGKAIVWPKPSHAAPDNPEVRTGKLKPWRTAAECIDWSIPVKSIFNRKKPLAENTMRRIALGMYKFVINNPKPYIAPVDPFLIKVNHSKDDLFRGQALEEPMQTITAKNGWGIVVPFLAKYNTETTVNGVRGQALDQPLLTQDTSNRFGLVAASLIKFRGQNIGQPADEPLHTVTAGGNHHGLVYAFLTAYYGMSIGQDINNPLCTITTHDRFSLVLVRVDGILYEILDIGMRMLEPHELFAAQGFPSNYIIDVDKNGVKYSKAKQVARCGNSVPPQLANVLVQANLPEHCPGSGKVLRFERYKHTKEGQLALSI